MVINNSHKTTNRAKRLRKESTLSEILLWKRLKNRQVRGCKFRRQVPIGSFIVDFYCHQLRLVIEIDGSSHFENADYDHYREKKLIAMGLAVLRFPDSMIKRNLGGVVMVIEEWIEKNEPSPR